MTIREAIADVIRRESGILIPAIWFLAIVVILIAGSAIEAYRDTHKPAVCVRCGEALR